MTPSLVKYIYLLLVRCIKSLLVDLILHVIQVKTTLCDGQYTVALKVDRNVLWASGTKQRRGIPLELSFVSTNESNVNNEAQKEKEAKEKADKDAKLAKEAKDKAEKEAKENADK